MEVLTDGSGICIKLNKVDDDEVYATHEIIHSHPKFESLSHVVIDLLDVAQMELTANAVREVAKRDAEHVSRNPGLKIAVLARADVIRGMINVYRSTAEVVKEDQMWRVQYFEFKNEAQRWLASNK